MCKRHKMSKSRGNVVSVDEVVRGVCSMKQGYEFQDVDGNIIDWYKLNVWKDVDENFYTAQHFGKQQVFLTRTELEK